MHGSARHAPSPVTPSQWLEISGRVARGSDRRHGVFLSGKGLISKPQKESTNGGGRNSNGQTPPTLPCRFGQHADLINQTSADRIYDLGSLAAAVTLRSTFVDNVYLVNLVDGLRLVESRCIGPSAPLVTLGAPSPPPNHR